MRRWVSVLIGLLMLAAPAAADPAPEVVAFVNALVGKTMYLKVDVVRVQYMLRGEDATNVYPDGLVRYQLRLGGFRRTESTSVEEFTKDAERSLQQNKTVGQVRVLNKGAKVTVAMTKPEDEEVEIEFRDSGNSKHKIRFKFDGGNYGVEDVKRLMKVCFADTQAEATNTATVTIKLGMTIDEVIAAKGAPKTRVDLGQKVILTYPDMKLVFEGGKLADVQ